MISTIVSPGDARHLPDKNLVFTFDDGPNTHRDVSARLLNVLADEKVRAIFCPVGRQCRQHRDLVRQALAEGHWIANHTVNHIPLQCFPTTRVETELDGFDEILAEITGDASYRSTLFRPPYGVIDGRLRRLMHQRQLGLCGLTSFHFDTLYPPSRGKALKKRILSSLRRQQSGVVVIHEKVFVDGFWRRGMPKENNIYNRDWIPQLVQDLISTLRAEGWSFDPTPYIALQTAQA